ncbi:MAG: AP2/ERF family transcription factor [Sedimentisphaerales bacterium]
MYLKFQIKVPAIIESIVVYFLLRYRKKRYGYAYRRIKLTQNKFAIVDPEDYGKLNIHKWFAKNDKNTYYAARIEGKRKIYMHRQIKPPLPGFVVDHINHKGFDNRKDNLQVVTIAENNWNSRKTRKERSSKYKGVSRCKRTNKWRAVICVNGLDMHLGYYDEENEAAKAYDEAAKKYRGDFAVLNFEKDSHQDTKAQRKILNPNIYPPSINLRMDKLQHQGIKGKGVRG